ncbi:MAG: SMC-Scp complex subunit ScpB [Syntrophobacterales bacterium]|nr:MAG: SMC-Scp complex subunit ScpB [Syntrophobacterales bacterium]
MDNLKSVVEALIFVSDIPISLDKMRDILGEEVKKKDIAEIVEEITRDYAERRGGIFVNEIAGGYQFRTGEDNAPWIRKLKAIKPMTLSPAAMETLAVIVYKQPIMKSEIEQVRGVDVSGILKGLMEKKLVKIVGRKDVPGRPIIYGTTRKFMEVFNLRDLSDLPTLKEIEE